MKYTSFILTFVASSLFIFSIKLEAMEASQHSTTNFEWLTKFAKNVSDNEENFKKRRRRYEKHQYSPKNQTQSSTAKPEWLMKLVQSFLGNEKNFNKRRNRYKQKTSSLKAQKQQLKLQEEILPHLRHDCCESSPPDIYWGTKILELFITQPTFLIKSLNKSY